MAALSNVQESTVSRNLHNTVVKVRPYPLVRELQRVEKNWEKRTKFQKNVKEGFHVLEPFHLEE